MKKYIKKILGFLICHKSGIIYNKLPNISLNIKIINKGTIKIKKDVTIRSSTGLYTHNSNSYLELGNNVEIGNHSTISARGSVILQDGVLTGPHIFISDSNHEYHNPFIHIYKQGAMHHKGDRVLIGEGTWIGTNVVIAGNIRIGKQCVIGANSVVTKDIPDYSVAAGTPCKVLKRYNLKTNQWEKV